MAKAIESVVCTISGGRLLGTMWLPSTRHPLQPSPCAAITNSCSRSASTELRLKRAYAGMETRLMAKSELRRPGPIMATMAMASKVAGNASTMSMQNITTRSTRPRR